MAEPTPLMEPEAPEQRGGPRELNEAIKARRRLRRSIAFTILSYVVAIGFLYQWGKPDPWARIDFFVATYLLATAFFRVRRILNWRKSVYRSEEKVKEAAGLTFNPTSGRWMSLLALSQPLVFLDYGQLHLLPALDHPALQSIGLVFYFFAEFCWGWVDSYLSRHFAASLDDRQLIDQGPYRWARHPRYTGMIVGKLGVALVFASVLGLMMALGWLVLIVRRIPMEEAHLRKIFGAQYEAYSKRTARLFVGLY